MAKKKQDKKFSSFRKLCLMVFLFLVILFLFLFEKRNTEIMNKKVSLDDQKILKSISYVKLTLTPTATPTATPTLSPTPGVIGQFTKNNYSGFCLNVPVLFYHHIQPENIAREKGQTAFTVDSGIFDQQVSYLKSSGYNIISAKQLVNALRTHTQLGKSAVITMDDGYRDIYEYAFPILKKYGVVANVAVISGLVEGADYLTWSQISEMGGSGLFSFMDHTWSHFSLPAGSADKVEMEIMTAKKQIQDRTGQNIDLIVYPYGSFNDFTVNAVRKDGFAGGFSTIGGIYQCDSFILTLHRTRIGNAPLSYYGI